MSIQRVVYEAKASEKNANRYTNERDILNSDMFSQVHLLKAECVTPYCNIFSRSEKRLIAKVDLKTDEVIIRPERDQFIGPEHMRRIKEHCEVNKKAMWDSYNFQWSKLK